MMRNNVYRFAYDHIGIKEIKGALHNSLIQKMYVAVVGKIFRDETPWCAAFVGYCLASLGLDNTGKLNARSYLKYGYSISDVDGKPEAGDIVVLWRGDPNSWKGHVGFYAGSEDDYIYILGGNQNDQVSVAKYPMNRVLDIRRYNG